MDKGRFFLAVITAATMASQTIHAEESNSPLLTALESTTISGYVDSGNWNAGSGISVPGVTSRILWQHDDGRVNIWHMSATHIYGGERVAIPTFSFPAEPRATALGHGPVIFQVADALVSGNNFINATPLVPLKEMSFGGAADLVGTPDPDLFWVSRFQLLVWEMNGSQVIRQHLQQIPIYIPIGARFVSTADFNNDGSPDLLWQDSSGVIWITLMNGTMPHGNVIVNGGRPANLNWILRGAAHFNRDNQADLLWQHRDGRLATWFMNGTTRLSSALLNEGKSVPAGWKLKDANSLIPVTRNPIRVLRLLPEAPSSPPPPVLIGVIIGPPYMPIFTNLNPPTIITNLNPL